MIHKECSLLQEPHGCLDILERQMLRFLMEDFSSGRQKVGKCIRENKTKVKLLMAISITKFITQEVVFSILVKFTKLRVIYTIKKKVQHKSWMQGRKPDLLGLLLNLELA
jgi:hypothetical protein